MPRGSNCRGKKKMIPLTWEAFLLLLSKYTEHLTISRPLTGTALPDPLPAQHSFSPAQTSRASLAQANPSVSGNTDVSAPATSATSLGG